MLAWDSGNIALRPDGRLARVEGIDALRQALVMLMETSPGERRMAPDFGCPLDRLAFEPLDDTTAGLAIRMVSEAVARFVPEARVDLLDAGPDPSVDSRLLIRLEIRDAQGAAARVETTIPVGGEG